MTLLPDTASSTSCSTYATRCEFCGTEVKGLGTQPDIAAIDAMLILATHLKLFCQYAPEEVRELMVVTKHPSCLT